MIRPALLALLALAGCSERTTPTARELSDIVVHPDSSFTVKEASLDKDAPEPAPDSGIRGFALKGCAPVAGQTGAVRCAFSLVLFDPYVPDDAGTRFTGEGVFTRKGARWTAAQSDYLLTRVAEAKAATRAPDSRD